MMPEHDVGAGIKAGLFTPLGQGDVDIAGVVSALESRGYDGWFVLEQDTTPDDPKAVARANRLYLEGLLATLPPAAPSAPLDSVSRSVGCSAAGRSSVRVSTLPEASRLACGVAVALAISASLVCVI